MVLVFKNTFIFKSHAQIEFYYVAKQNSQRCFLFKMKIKEYFELCVLCEFFFK